MKMLKNKTCIFQMFIAWFFLSSVFILPLNAKEILTAEKFSNRYLELVKKQHPNIKVKRLDALGFKFTSTKTGVFKAFLDNAYREYKNSPDQITSILQRYVDIAFSANKLTKLVPKRDQIVPLIRSIDYINQIKKLTKNAKKENSLIYKEFVPGLVLLYALDSPKSVRALVNSDLNKLKIKNKELLGQATKNLNRIVSNGMKRQGKEGLFAVTAGGTFESSLVLLDDIWNKKNFPVKGDFVVYIPARDQIIITGSKDKKGLAEAAKFAKKDYQVAPRPLFNKPLIRQNGKWIIYKK